jgi:hypothetical protein
MKSSKWTNRIVGFVLGLLVAGTLAFALPRNQASPEVDIYKRVELLEKRVGGLESAEKYRNDREESERRRFNGR